LSESQEPGLEKTKVIRVPSKKEQIEKTIIVSGNPLKDIIESPSDESEVLEKPEILEEVEEESEPVDENTQLFNYDEALSVINRESQRSEKEFVRELQLIEHGEDERELDSDDAEELEEETVKKKGLKPIALFAVIALLAMFLFPEKEEVVEIKPVFPNIEFPIGNEFIDELRSDEALGRAKVFLQDQTYISTLKAAQELRKSLNHKFNDNESTGLLILAYSLVLENAKEQRKAASTIFNLIKIAKPKLYTDPNVAMGVALFYSKMGKHQAAVNIIENYNRISSPTAELYGSFLDITISSSRLDQSAIIFSQLEKIENRPLNAYLSMIRLLELNQRYEQAEELASEGLERFPSSVALLLKSASVSLHLGKIEDFKASLEKIKANSAEQSPVYYSKYLEYQGMLAAAAGDVEKAGQLFKQALDFNESHELRSKLSQLEIGGSKLVSDLILESKVIEKMNQAEEEIRLRNWDRALMRAIEAADMLPHYIPSQLLLVEIQTKRGYFEHALQNLERLREIYPVNDMINYHLVRTLIKARRVDDAEREIVILAQTDFARTSEYAFVLGELYNQTENLNLAIRNFRESHRLNPLDDTVHFELAKIFLRGRRYDDARAQISAAIELDPVNVFYHSIYAQILYEMESADTAIGYLRKILDTNPDNPKVIGDIGIYYFRVGKIAEFENYKKRLEALRNRDESFYEFLISASRLRGNNNDVVTYSKELIRVNPGDLEARMTLGSFLINLERNREAIEEFLQVTERLENYPRANYWIAKAYISLREYDNAVKFAQKEIDGNPEIEGGYYVMGEALRLKQDFQEALKFLEQAVSINGNSVEALISLGWIYFRQNFLEKARELYLRAQREDPSVAEVHKQLGFIYRESGQSRLAAESFNTYLQLSPNARDRNEIEGIIRRSR
jgi:tetratricopeptide (TPR) repeat protein